MSFNTFEKKGSFCKRRGDFFVLSNRDSITKSILYTTGHKYNIFLTKIHQKFTVYSLTIHGGSLYSTATKGDVWGNLTEKEKTLNL